MIKFGASLRAVNQGAVRVHHTFGIARGAGCEEHGGHIVFGADFNLFFVKVGMLLGKGFARCQQFVHRTEPRFVVFTQAPGVVVINVRECGVGFTHLQHLVHLLLIFHHTQTHLGIGHGKNTLRRRCVLVQRNGYGAKRLRSQHGGVKARTVRAHHNHVLTAL